MCSLCGVLGGGTHWTESTSHPEAFSSRAELHTRRRERQGQVRLANAVLKHYGLTLNDWSGASFVLRSATGRSQIVANLGEVWIAAQQLCSRPCDPLDGGLLAYLGRR